MRTAFRRLSLAWALALFVSTPLMAQSSTGTVQGTVKDNQDGVVPGATATIRNTQTNSTRTVVSDDNGSYRFLNMPVGDYELTIELSGFAKYVRSGITLSVNQDAVIDVRIQPASISEAIEVNADAPLLNTTTPEVGVRFDTTRVAELPVSGATFRDIFALALSAPGVSQLGSGQTGFASGTNFSSNGMRVRSNNFMIDGQDSNDPSVTGRQQPINNTDIIQEVRLITNQFAAEFGRAAGSVVNAVTKSGTNAFHGSGFGFFNDESLNSRSNLDKAAGRTSAPFREERQYGGTFGGPVMRDKTFFFGSYQRWTDRQLGSGFTLNGAPTEAGRQILQAAAGSRAQVQALLQYLPAAQTPIAKSATFSTTPGGPTFTVPLGSLTGSSSIVFDNNQASARIDQQFGNNHTLTGRYLYGSTPENSGTGQVTPPGLTTVNTSNQHSLNAWLSSVLSQTTSNEFRVAWSHLGTVTGAQDPASEAIPSLEITELGMTGFNAAASRTAIGLAVNLPQFRYNDTYQFQNALTHVRGNHLFKAGFDVRYQYVKSFFFPTIRGLLRYATLDSFVNDLAEAANINKPLPGGEEVNYYRWWDQVLLRAGRVEGETEPDAELRAALRAPGQQHPEPDRPPGADSIGQRQQRRLPAPADPRHRHEQFPAPHRLQLVAGDGDQRVHRTADRRRQVRAARGLWPDERLRLPQHRAQHRQLVSLRRGHQPQQPVERLHAVASDAAGGAAGHQSQHADPNGRGRRLPIAAGGSVQPRDPAPVVVPPRDALRVCRHVWKGPVPDARWQPATGVLWKPVHGRPPCRHFPSGHPPSGE